MSKTTTPLCTDYGRDLVTAGKQDECDRCAYCGSLYDPANEGHTDETTDLSFCDAPCEMHYFQENAVPSGYVFAP